MGNAITCSLGNQKRHLKLSYKSQIEKKKKKNLNSKAFCLYHEGTSTLTSRSKSPMTPSTSPAAPTIPMDSPNNKDASIATVKG